jgi:hypothetical protein
VLPPEVNRRAEHKLRQQINVEPRSNDMSKNSERPPLTHASGTPVTDNLNIQTAGPRGPALLQDV